MISDQMRDYIESCKRQGYSDDQIRQALLSAGWPAQSVQEALLQPAPVGVQPPIIPVKQAYPVIKPHHRIGLALILLIGFLLLSSAGTVVLAEYGYLPAVSRIYRKTKLPLLWKGTTSDAVLSIGGALQRSSAETNAQYAGSYAVTISGTGGQSHAYLRDIPLIGKRVASYLPEKVFASQPLIATSEAVAASSAPLDMSVPASLKLPLTINASYTLQTDKDKNSETKVSIDLASVLAAIPEFSSFVSPDMKTVTSDIRTFPSKKTSYFKSNAIPTKTVADGGKWFAYDLPVSTIDGSGQINPYSSLDLPKGDDLKKFQKLVGSITKDNGIVRRGGEALAHYTLTIDTATVAKIKNDESLKQYLTYFEEALAEGFTLKADIFLEPTSSRIREVDILATVHSPLMPYTLTFALNNKVSYGAKGTVATPETAQVHEQKFDDYVQSLANVPSAQLTSTGMFSKESWDMISAQTSTAKVNAGNATRKSDITQLGMEMEIYLSSQESSGTAVQPPSTNGTVQRLDQAGTALESIPEFKQILPLHDPEPQTYYYGYKSDGTSYEFTCVVLDKVTGVPSGLFGIRNGSTFEQAL